MKLDAMIKNVVHGEGNVLFCFIARTNACSPAIRNYLSFSADAQKNEGTGQLCFIVHMNV